MRKVLRWVRRIVLGIVGLVVAVVAIALIVIHTDWGREQLRQQVIAAMHDGFPGGVQIGRLDGSVLGDLVLRDVVINDFDGKPAISAKTVTLNVGFRSLLSNEIKLESLVLDGLVVDVKMVEGKPLNVAQIYKPSADPFTWNVSLPDVQIHRGSITIDRDGQLEHLDGLELRAAATVLAEGTIDATLKLDGVLRERAEAPLAVAAVVHLDDLGITVPSASAAVGQVSITAADVAYRSATDVRGAILIRAAEGELARLAPELGVPGWPIELSLAVEPVAPDALSLAVKGSFAGARLDGTVVATPTAAQPTVRGQLALDQLDLVKISPALPPTSLTGALTVDVKVDPSKERLAMVTGTVAVTGHGTVAEVALDDVALDVAIADGAADATLRGQGPGGAVVELKAHVVDGDRLRLSGGRLDATVASLRAATLGKAPVDGSLTLALDFSGEFGGDADPEVDLHAVAKLRDLRMDDLRIGALDVEASARGVPDALRGEVHATARQLRLGREALPDVTVTARGGLTGPIDVAVAAKDRKRSLDASLAARVVLGPADSVVVADVTLGRYRIARRRVALEGNGGRITLEQERVVVRGLRARGAGGALAIDAIVGLGPRAGALSGKLALANVDLAQLRGLPGVPANAGGIVSMSADLAARGRSIQGEAQLSARGLVVSAGARPIDVALSTEIRPDRVELAVTADGAELGTLSAAIDVVPPRRLDDLAAWSRLDRKALRAVRLEAKSLDLARLQQLIGRPPTVEGSLDAKLELDATTASVQVRGRRLIAAGVPAPVDVDLDLDLTDPKTAAVTASATLREIGKATIKTAVELPSRPFDLAAWKAVDLRALQGIEIAIDKITIDEAMARRLGLEGVRGTISATITAEAGLRAMSARILARDLIAPPLAQPIAFNFEASVGKDGTKANVELCLEDKIVATVEASTPTTLAQLLAGQVDLKAMPIDATIAILDGELAPFARAAGQAPKLAGRIRGEGKVSGTVGAPTGTLSLVISNLASRVRRGSAPRGGLRELQVEAKYAGGTVHGELHGTQDDGGQLRLIAEVDPTNLADARASITANKFQLAPLTRLAPTVLLGVRGMLDADLQVRGTDLKTGQVSGVLKITGVQLPIADSIGNLRDGTIDLAIDGGVARLAIDGSLEQGRIALTANATLNGLRPRSGSLDLTLTQASLITSLAPRFNAKLHVDVQPKGDHWRAIARLTDADVTVPHKEGHELHPAGLPADLVFTSDTRVGVPVPRTQATVLKEWLGARPSDPLLELALTIDPVTVVSSQFRGEVGGKLDIVVGTDGASIDGRIGVPRGNVVLFERRYTLRDAGVVFDGSIDPLLEIQLEYEFPQLQMKVVVGGRVSKPTLTLSSTPSTYTEGQLLGFLLGGSPGAAGRETVDAATGVAAALASQVIGGFVTRKLPIRLDVLNYEPTTSSSSGAFVFGRWITSKLLVLLRTRVEARVDENVSEAQAEYWLDQRLLLEGTAGDRGVLGLDLLWNRRW